MTASLVSSCTMPCIPHSADTNNNNSSSAFLSYAGMAAVEQVGGGRLRSGSVLYRPTSSSRLRVSVIQPPSMLLAAAGSSAPSSSSAGSASLLMGSAGGSAGGSASASVSVSVSGSAAKAGVGSIFSRMWGAAAANLKGVSGSGSGSGGGGGGGGSGGPGVT